MNNLDSLLRRMRVRIAVKLYHLGLVGLAEFSAGMGLDEIETEYQDTLYGAMADYLESSRPVTSFKNEFARAVNDAFTLAFYAGWADGGASGPIPDDAQAWLNGRIDQEIAFADELFTKLKILRDDPETSPDDKLAYAEMRAQGYTASLAGVYNQGKMMADPYRVGVWHLGPTSAHCDTCAWLDGQEHPLQWYLDNGYVPQEPGSSQLDCRGYNCLCTIDSPEGDQLVP